MCSGQLAEDLDRLIARRDWSSARFPEHMPLDLLGLESESLTEMSDGSLRHPSTSAEKLGKRRVIGVEIQSERTLGVLTVPGAPLRQLFLKELPIRLPLGIENCLITLQASVFL